MTKRKPKKYIASLLYPSMLEDWKTGDHNAVLQKTANDSFVAAMFTSFLCARREIDVLDEFLSALQDVDTLKRLNSI